MSSARATCLLLLFVAILAAVAAYAGTDERTAGLTRHTFWLAAATCCCSLPVGGGLALLLVKTDVPARHEIIVAFAAMLLVPVYVQCAAWDAGFGLQGWYTLAYQGPALLSGWRGAVWVHTMVSIPWVVLIVGVALRTVEAELEEAAMVDGSPLQVFHHVTVRRTAAGLLTAAAWVAVAAAGEMTVTDLFGIRTYAEEIYTAFSQGGGFQEVAGGFWLGTLFTLLFMTAAWFLCQRLTYRVTWVGWQPARVFRLGKWRLLAQLYTWGCALLVCGLPLIDLIYKAGVTVTQTETGRERSWSALKVLYMVGSSPHQHGLEIGWSGLIGASAATTTVVISLLLAWFARTGTCKASQPFTSVLRTAPALTTAAVCLSVPGPVIGMVLIWLLGSGRCAFIADLYDYTILAPWLAQTLRTLPFSILILWHAFDTVNSEVLHAAITDGASWSTQLTRVAIPSRWPAIAIAWLVSLIIAMGDLAATVLVVPPGMPTLSVRIFGLLHYGVEDRVASLCLAILIVVAAVALAVLSILRKMKSKRSHSG